MDMNEEQRGDFASRIKAVRLRRFGGSRKAAYTAAGVNSGTWTRAESGLSIAERSVVSIVQALWPESGGDWEALIPPLGPPKLVSQIEAEIEASDLSPSTKTFIREILADNTPPDPPASDSQEGVTGA